MLCYTESERAWDGGFTFFILQLGKFFLHHYEKKFLVIAQNILFLTLRFFKQKQRNLIIFLTFCFIHTFFNRLFKFCSLFSYNFWNICIIDFLQDYFQHLFFPFEFVYMLIYVCVRVCMCNFYLISRLFEQFFHFTNTRDAFNRKTEFNQDLSARPMSPAVQRDTQTDGRTAAASPKKYTRTQQTELHTNIVFLTLLVQHLVYCWGQVRHGEIIA